MTTIASAVFAGIGVLFAGSLAWGLVLAPLNLRFWPAVPWAIVPMAAYLWTYWRFVGGRLGSDEGATWRREQLRANPVGGDVWPIALVTGVVGFAALLVFVTVMARVVPMASPAAIVAPAGMPRGTIVIMLVMASLVAGVTEEAAFRGYMQGAIERRYGLAAAILVNGVMFGLLHFPNHPAATLTMLPYYVAVAALYSGVTWAADSILPAVVLHAGGDVWSLTRLWATGRPEWQVTEPPPLIWQTGLDGSAVGALLALVILSAVTFWLCIVTRGTRRGTRIGVRS
jgi:uncharacterized protein